MKLPKLPEMFRLPRHSLPDGWKESTEWAVFIVVVIGWLVVSGKAIYTVWRWLV